MSVLSELRSKITTEVSKVVVGQQTMIDGILISLVSGGHVLLDGVPGVAKTLLATAVAKTFGADFRRLQFTPDMLPSDVTGTMILKEGELVFRHGPVFTNFLLADEVNRTPPKTQAALLESMQEGQVSIEGVSYRLPDPFLVIATQNPIEYEGTYPLPEAQLDRFIMKLDVGYPSDTEELALLKMHYDGIRPAGLDQVSRVVTLDELKAGKDEVDITTLNDSLVWYIASLIRSTRVLPAVQLGASPRAGVHLLACAKAMARFNDRSFVIPEDIAQIAVPVLAHRLVLKPEADLDRYKPADAIRTTLASVPIPR